MKKEVKKMLKLLNRIQKEYEKSLNKLTFYRFKNYCILNNYKYNKSIKNDKIINFLVNQYY